MSGSLGVVTNAAAVPVSAVKGATASIKFCCSLSKSSVGSTTMPARPMSFQYHNKYSAAEGGDSESALLRSGRLGPAQHSFGDVAVQRFSFARDGGILHGQRSDWRWSFQGSRHRRAWLLFWLRPANAGESCYLIQLGGSHHSVHSLNCQNLHIDSQVIAPSNAW